MKLVYNVEDIKEYKANGTEGGKQQWSCITTDNREWTIWTPKWALDSLDIEEKLIEYINQKNQDLINEIKNSLLMLTTMYLTSKANEDDKYIDNIINCSIIGVNVFSNDLTSITINENGLVETEDIYELAGILADTIYEKLEKMEA